jgi:hypothetical protein
MPITYYFWVSQLRPIFKKVMLFSTLAVLIAVSMFFALTYLSRPKSPSQILPMAKGVYDGFQLTLTLEKTEYNLSEPINMTLTLTNISNQTASVVFGDGLSIMGFQVYNSTNSTIYSSYSSENYAPNGEIQATIPLQITEPLNAGKSLSTEFSWQHQSSPVLSGTYYIVGQISPINNDEASTIETTPIEMTILTR